MLSIITISKDDTVGIKRTVLSVEKLLSTIPAEQIVVESCIKEANRLYYDKFLLNRINVSHFHTEPKGIPAAFNYGLKVSKYPWVWFLNGGDSFLNLVKPDILKNIITLSSADLILFEIKSRQSNKSRRHPPIWKRWPPFNNWIPHPGAIMKRSLFETYGNFDTMYKFAMDFDIWLRILSKDIVVDTISIPLADFDETGDSSTNLKQVSKYVLKAIWKNKGSVIKSIYLSKKDVVASMSNHIRFFLTK